MDGRDPRWASRRSRRCRCSSRRDDVLNFVLLVLLSITMAQSWNIVAGYAGQVNLGHAAFFGLGALTARTLWIAGTPILLAMGAGALVAVALALLIGAAAFRLRGAYFAIGTLALGEILRTFVSNTLPEISTLPGGQHRGLPARAALLPGPGAGRPVGDRGGRARRLAPRARHAGHPRGRGRGGGHRGGRAVAEAARARALDRAGRARGRLLRLLPHQLLSVASRSGRTGRSRRCS